MTAVNLVVKAPNQKIDDQVRSVELGWSVLQLKTFLSTDYPSKPVSLNSLMQCRMFTYHIALHLQAVGEQRLIYSGHLLRDDQILRDIFQPITEDNVTVHLVCAHKSPVNGPNVVAASPRLPEPTLENPSLAAFSDVQSAPVSADFNWPAQPVYNNFALPMMMTPEQMMQQMAMMQQMYAQFVAQYQDQMNVTEPHGLNLQQMPSFPNVNIGGGNAANGPAPPQPMEQQPVMNAGPGGAVAVDDDDDLNNRDWLDWVYWSSRAIVLFSIVYFYSSFSRFVVVLILAAMMYLYQIGWLFPRERNDAPFNENVPAPPVNPENANDLDAQRIQEIMDGAEPQHRRSTAEPLVVEQTERFSGLRLFWVIVSSLFTSLIPEQIPANI